jgi:hypothetical protein
MRFDSLSLLSVLQGLYGRLGKAPCAALFVYRPTSFKLACPVTTFAGQLQKAGLVRYSRGSVELLDPAGLEHLACDCRGELQRQRIGLVPLQVGDPTIRLISG